MARKFNEWDVVEMDGKKGVVTAVPGTTSRVYTVCFSAEHVLATHDARFLRYCYRATPELVIGLINASEVA